MSKKLWQKGSVVLHPLVEEYTVGEDPLLDTKILPYDVDGTRAHVKGLHKIGILSDRELKQVLAALNALMRKYRQGKIRVTLKDEDCHTLIEKFVTQQAGSVGKKIHTGRSRNDQVLTAVRLYLLDHANILEAMIRSLAREFLKKAEQYQSVPLPGYSHTQQAMLTTCGHYLLSFVESLLDDADYLKMMGAHLSKSPLGSAAGFGVPLKLQRDYVAKELGFGGVYVNSLYAQAQRGKGESLYLEGLSQVMLTLGRFASDLILFSSREFSFFSVKENLLTGSSIMPQKKNYDAMEILRANGAVVQAHQSTLRTLAKGLTSGYHRDFQLMKKPLIESTEIITQSVEVVRLFISSLRVHKQSIAQKIQDDIFMADYATLLASEEGIPFRDAYKRVVSDGSLSLDPEVAVKKRLSIGAPGNLQLHRYKKRFS